MSQYKRHYNFGQIVFITIVVNNRKAILPDNIQLIRDSFKSVKYKFTIIAGIILKDHLHILIQPENMYEIPKIVTFIFSKSLILLQTLPTNHLACVVLITLNYHTNHILTGLRAISS